MAADAAVPFTADVRSPALDRLADRLKTVRVIGIGEATHGSHGDQAFEAQLIETLVRRGRIDVVAVEANNQAGLNFDDYIERGIGDPAAAVASDSFLRIGRTTNSHVSCCGFAPGTALRRGRCE